MFEPPTTQERRCGDVDLARLRSLTAGPFALHGSPERDTPRQVRLDALRGTYAWAIDTLVDMVSVDAAIEAVVGLARNDTALNEGSTTQFARGMGRFGAHLRFHGVERLCDVTQDHVVEFVAGAALRHGVLRDPSASTIRGRQWMIGRFLAGCAQLGWPLALVVPDVASTRDAGFDWARPLTDDEMARCEHHAQLLLTGDLVTVAIALAEAGADTGEIWQVRVRDIDLDHGTVRLVGNARHAARVNGLTPWAQAVLDRRIAELWYDADLPVAVNAATTGSSATAAIAQRLRTGLDRAGLTRDPHVRPGSVRAWSAAAVFAETGRIETVARWLGYRRLDHASRVIGYQWADL